MSSGQHASCFPYLLASAKKDLAKDIQIHGFRETDNIKGCLHIAAHGVDVTERIGRSYLPEDIRVLHHGRKEIQGLDHGQVICQPVDSRII